MKKQIVITYEWENFLNKENPIRKEHRKALDETAIKIIATDMIKGGENGELRDNIYMCDDDPQEGVEYTGSWRMHTTEI